MRTFVLCERVDSIGGTETYLRALLPALQQRGDDVMVAARSADEPGAYGVPAVAVPWSDEHDPPSARAALRVKELCDAFDPDVVVAHNVLDAGVLAAARTPDRRRFVYHVHDHRPFCPNGDRLYPQGGGICGVPMGRLTCGWHALRHGCGYGPRPGTIRLIDIRGSVADCVKRADAVVTLSHYVADVVERNGVERGVTRVVSPPLDDAAFVVTPAPRPAVDAVLFAGRVMPSKGARSLIRAVASLDRATRPVVRIAGDGPDLDATVREARARDVRLETLGRLSPEAMRQAYDDATVVAVPSLWGEPFGLVGIEAFARGRPVVAYAAGAIPEWLAPSGQMAVARGDTRALASSITALLPAQVWDAASSRALDAAQTYRLSTHVDELRSIYAATR